MSVRASRGHDDGTAAAGTGSVTRCGVQRTGDLRFDDRRGWLAYTGQTWLPAAYSLRPERLKQPQPLEQDATADDARRERLLAQVVDDLTLQGCDVKLKSQFRVVVARRRPVNHFLHLILTVLTVGVWGLIWLIMAIARKDDLTAYEVDRQGHVWLQDGGTAG